MAKAAWEEAGRAFKAAEAKLGAAALEEETGRPLREILDRASAEIEEGKAGLEASENSGSEAIYDIYEAVRHFTAAQAFSNQVYEVFAEPKSLEN